MIAAFLDGGLQTRDALYFWVVWRQSWWLWFLLRRRVGEVWILTIAKGFRYP